MSENETNTLRPELAQHFDLGSQRTYATLEESVLSPAAPQEASKTSVRSPFSRLVPQENGNYSLEPVIRTLDI